MDIITFVDKKGKQFSYAIGENISNLNSAAEISKKVIYTLPGYALKNFNGILITEKYHPIDLYWQKYYEGTGYKFRHGAMYSGEPITIHQKYDKITGYDISMFDKGYASLRNDFIHELGHHIQDKLDIMEYYNAMISDRTYFRDYNKDAILQKINYFEDIEDSFSMFITAPAKMKRKFPNRYAIIQKMTTKL